MTAASSILTIEAKPRHRAEQRTDRFVRTVQLPDGVRATEIRATFENGVLEVEIPLPIMAAAATPYRVTIGRDPTAAFGPSAA